MIATQSSIMLIYFHFIHLQEWNINRCIIWKYDEVSYTDSYCFIKEIMANWKKELIVYHYDAISIQGKTILRSID